MSGKIVKKSWQNFSSQYNEKGIEVVKVADQAMPVILIRSGPNRGTYFEIKDEVLGVGRDDSEDIQIYDQGVSRKHAEIFRVGEMYFIRDLGSKNGTYVNGERITEELLRAGDVIRIGSAVLSFEEELPEDIEGWKKGDGKICTETASSPLEITGEFQTLDEPSIEDTFEPEMAQESRDLQILYEVALVLSESSDPKILMQRIVQIATSAVEGDEGYIFTKDLKKKELVLEASYAPNRRRKKPAISRGIIRKAIKTRRAILISDAQKDERFCDNISVVAKNIRSVICAPLVAQDQLNGVLYITRSDVGLDFTREDLELVTTIAIQLGIALQSIYSTQEQQKLILDTVRTLVQVIEMRDPEQRGFSNRVANYAASIAYTMGLSKSEIQRVYLSALLHNLGRIALSDLDIRRSKDPKDPKERLEYKQAIRAEEILRENPGMAPLIPGVKYHNEHYDGSGLPEGRKGEEIPLEARIIAVAKGFAKYYRESDKRRAIKEALMKLQKKCGSLYDKSVVQALVIAYRSGHLFRPPLGGRAGLG